MTELQKGCYDLISPNADEIHIRENLTPTNANIGVRGSKPLGRIRVFLYTVRSKKQLQ